MLICRHLSCQENIESLHEIYIKDFPYPGVLCARCGLDFVHFARDEHLYVGTFLSNIYSAQRTENCFDSLICGCGSPSNIYFCQSRLYSMINVYIGHQCFVLLHRKVVTDFLLCNRLDLNKTRVLLVPKALDLLKVKVNRKDMTQSQML